MVTRNGIASVEGLAAGTAFLLRKNKGPGQAVVSLDEAFEAERERLEALSQDGESEAAGIFAAHLEILEDPMLRESIEAHLGDGLSPIEAVEAASKELAAMFEEIEDEYLRARADDVRDICRSLSERLSGSAGDSWQGLPEDAVIVAEELFPSDTTEMDFGKIRSDKVFFGKDNPFKS